MPDGVAEPAGSDNVLARVSPAILFGLQVLGSTLKAGGISLADFVFGGEVCWILQPHWKSAVVATAFLTIECSETVFDN